VEVWLAGWLLAGWLSLLLWFEAFIIRAGGLAWLANRWMFAGCSLDGMDEWHGFRWKFAGWLAGCWLDVCWLKKNKKNVKKPEGIVWIWDFVVIGFQNSLGNVNGFQNSVGNVNGFQNSVGNVNGFQNSNCENLVKEII
jgi:hypothetical protein